MAKLVAIRTRHLEFPESQLLQYFILALVIFLLPQPAFSASFPLTSFPAFSTVAPCATGYLSTLWDERPWNGCSSNLPLRSYGSCICAYRMSSVNEAISDQFSIFDDECSTSGVFELVTQLCDWCGVDLGKEVVGTIGSAAIVTASSVRASSVTASSAGAGATGTVTSLELISERAIS